MTERLNLDAVHPQLRRAYRFLPNPPVVHGWQRALVRGATRLLPAPATPQGMTYHSEDLGGGVSVHVYAPASPRERAALLWIHGGGMVIGAAAQDHAPCLEIARQLDLVVVSVAYRLAPEHPYPAPLDDCRAVWRWMVDHAAELGVDVGRIAIGGQSAGGGLAAGLVQRLHDEGGVEPAAQWLFCPMLDDRTASDRSLDAVRHLLWNNRSNRAGWGAYLGTPPGGPDAPAYAAPARRTDLSGLPPAWVGVGSIDLFHDEVRRYAASLTDAGVPTTLEVVPGGPHALESVAAAIPVARDYVTSARRWLADRLAPEPQDAPRVTPGPERP